jgi:hypothetical protein
MSISNLSNNLGGSNYSSGSDTKIQQVRVFSDPKDDPSIKQTLDRWQPKSKDASFLGIKDEESAKKPAKDFLADPVKVGITDFAVNTFFWVGVPHLVFDGLHFIVDKIPQKTVAHLPKLLSEGVTFLKTNGSSMGKLMLIEGAIAALIQIPLSLGVWNNQKTLNEKVLKTLKEQGIDAPLGDTLRK